MTPLPLLKRYVKCTPQFFFSLDYIHFFSCVKEYGKYTCPKCDIPYCSLSCYKKHGENCLETFYHENIVENLKSLKSTNEEKVEMLNILKRVKEAEETQVSNDSLIEKLEELDLSISFLTFIFSIFFNYFSFLQFWF